MFDELHGKGVFHDAIPPKPMGHYAHLLVVRETESFPVFRTDGELNIARVRAGLAENEHSQRVITRLVIFKRKQSAPERLSGRELLRAYGLMAAKEEEEAYCEYNSEQFCKKCPDCIWYGFAIGDAGSERSKVLYDSAFSVTGYDESHHQYSFNALYEHGTMSQKGEVRSSFGEQDYVIPQVFFPGVVTLRDPTAAGFTYVLANLLRTSRYGAETTRTGRVENHLVGLAFTDGEIFSNLRFTQKLYDHLASDGKLPSLLDREHVLKAADQSVQELIQPEPVRKLAVLTGEMLEPVLTELNSLFADQGKLKELLQNAYNEASEYSKTYLQKPEKKKK